MVAVKDFNVYSGLRHPACNPAELTRNSLIQPLNQYFPLFDHANARLFERVTRRCPILEEKVCDAVTVDDECASALDTHTGATQCIPHLCERARTVVEGNGQILHATCTVAAWWMGTLQELAI